MALTPEDVVNKRFQPTKFREGYDQDEVDDFLDEVVVELRRLGQENEELRQRLVASDSRISELQRSGGQSAPQQAAPQQIPEPVAAQEEAPGGNFFSTPPEESTPTAAFPPAPAAAPAAPATPVAAPVPVADTSVDAGNTNNLLQLARRLHEEHVREGVEKRDALIAEGHATAARVVADAETRQRAEITALEQERQGLEQERQGLETRIDELRTFEREYRQKLKGYIEGQLAELDSTTPLTTGAPAAAASAPATPQYSAPAAAQQPPASFTGFAGN